MGDMNFGVVNTLGRGAFGESASEFRALNLRERDVGERIRHVLRKHSDFLLCQLVGDLTKTDWTSARANKRLPECNTYDQKAKMIRGRTDTQTNPIQRE